jgi:phosphoribosylamine--glycine ligase
MLVSGGYPGKYEKEKVISGLENLEESIPFHAGTKLSGKQILSNGGRVIALSSFGLNMKDALKKSYNSAEKVNFEGKNYRKDIGFDL